MRDSKSRGRRTEDNHVLEPHRSKKCGVFNNDPREASPGPDHFVHAVEFLLLLVGQDLHAESSARTCEFPKSDVVQTVDSSASQAEVDMVREVMDLVSYPEQNFFWQRKQNWGVSVGHIVGMRADSSKREEKERRVALSCFHNRSKWRKA